MLSVVGVLYETDIVDSLPHRKEAFVIRPLTWQLSTTHHLHCDLLLRSIHHLILVRRSTAQVLVQIHGQLQLLDRHGLLGRDTHCHRSLQSHCRAARPVLHRRTIALVWHDEWVLHRELKVHALDVCTHTHNVKFLPLSVVNVTTSRLPCQISCR